MSINSQHGCNVLLRFFCDICGVRCLCPALQDSVGRVQATSHDIARVSGVPAHLSCSVFFMIAGDWLQGPHVYKLYSYYGYTKQEIGYLFIAGFFASAVGGTLVASLADRFGRKRLCLVYGITYSLSCLTKHLTTLISFSGDVSSAASRRPSSFLYSRVGWFTSTSGAGIPASGSRTRFRS